jgi:hypothetical protein
MVTLFYLSVCRFVCLSACLLFCLPVCPSACFYVRLPVCVSATATVTVDVDFAVFFSVCLIVRSPLSLSLPPFLFVSFYFSLSVCLSVSLSLCLSVSLSLCLSVSLSVYFSVSLPLSLTLPIRLSSFQSLSGISKLSNLFSTLSQKRCLKDP